MLPRSYPSRIVDDPPPPPALIDALADKPLAPEIAECETCPHLADCRRNYAQHRRFARSECSRALTPILPRNDGNATNQWAIAELRRGPTTVYDMSERTGVSIHVLYKILGRLVNAGLATKQGYERGTTTPATYTLQEQPC